MIGNVITGRAIYPSNESGFSVYVGLLIVSKFFRSVGLFIAYDLLKLIPVVPFLFILKAGTSLPLLVLQKPFASGRKLTKNQLFRVIRHAFFGSVISFLWLFGLTLCGPLRTILLFEHSDLVVIAGFSALFTNNGGGPAKSRGAVFFILAVLGVLLFDHDDNLHNEPEHLHSTFVSHLFYHIITNVGWSDHKGGVVLLTITLCLQVGFNSASKKLSVDIGGSKRLHALSTVMSTMLLLPWAGFIYLTRESDIQSWLYILFPLVLVIFFIFVFDYYIEAVAANHLHPPNTALVGTFSMLVSAVFLSYTWNHPLMAQVTTLHKLKELITEDHVLSGGVVFSVIIMMFGTRLLLAPSRGARGSFIGYSPAGLPLYSIAGDALQRTTHSVFMVLKNGLRQILEESDSRKIFYFLCINLSFTFVELAYGVWTNSLGLISDGFHMLFDCSALVMGLYAAIMSRWKATRIFSYGFDRVEVLSGFINGLFLVVIGIFVFAEAIARLFEPPEIHTERLLTVSIMGLLVNLTGIFAFRSAHGHSHGGHGHSHGGQASSHAVQASSHGHSHGGHGHSHGSHGQSHAGDHSLWGGQEHGHSPPKDTHNTNMEGVFLHILADTLGSVGVIISTLVIENFGWNIADPICSLFIATMILLSVFPLLKETSIILLLRTPTDLEKDINVCLQKVLTLEGVITYRDPHIWWHTSAKVMTAVHVQVTSETSEQKIVAQVSSIFKEAGITNLTVQVEKESYFLHLTGLGAVTDHTFDFTQNFHKQNHKESTSDVKAI